MYKKILSILIVLIVVLGFAGCTSNKATEEGTASILAANTIKSTTTCSSNCWTKVFEIQGNGGQANVRVLFGSIANLAQALKSGYDFKIVTLGDGVDDYSEYCTKVRANTTGFSCTTAVKVGNGEYGVGFNSKFFEFTVQGNTADFQSEEYTNVGSDSEIVNSANSAENSGHFAIYKR